MPDRVTACDAWVITGSPRSVTEQAPWMLRLEALLREARDAAVPVVGLCFGHQILAKALGGMVALAPNGWQLGRKDYDLALKPDWLPAGPDRLTLHAFHQDQVLGAPQGSTRLASAEGCPFAALAYGEWAVSFQAHPEFSTAFELALLTELTGKSVPRGVGQTALASFAEEPDVSDGLILGAGLRRFLKRAAGFAE